MGAPGRFGGVLCAMVTPFDDDGEVDLDGAAALAHWLVEHGNDGLVLTGSTGEGSVLGDQERADLLAAVRQAVAAPVIAATGTADTAHTIAVTKQAEAAGADAVMVVTPYYSRPSQAGIEAHFRAVAATTSLPVIAYDIPVRTGRRIGTEVLLRLAADGVIAAVKDASGDPAGTAALLARAPEGLEVYSGDDALTLPLLAVGAAGVISVASHWAGPQMSEMVAAFAKGDTEAARLANARLIDSYRFETSEDAPNPIPTKAMLRSLGLPGGQCRLPLGPAPAGIDDQARQVWARLNPEQAETRG
jgi:4-hydroxy-tetrahydrodipicolinate synthase